MPKIETLDDVILYPEEAEKLAKVKCTQCGCTGVFFQDLPDYKRLIEKGFGIRRMHLCIQAYCPCHYGLGKLPRILMKEVTLEEGLGVKNA